MVKIYCENINKEIIEVAQMISQRQKEDVEIIGPTVTLEVVYEEVSEMQNQEKAEEVTLQNSY